MALFFFISLSFSYAEAPELRNVMPNSWRKVTRLSGNEEAEFIQNNSDVLRQIAEVISSPIVSSGGMSLNVSDVIEKHTRVYKQETKGLIFYRLITSENMNFDNDESTLFLQSLLYNRGRENILLATAAYRKPFVYQDGANYFYSSIDIIEKNDSVSGILLSLVGVNQEHNALLKGQIAGSNHSFYLRWEDISGMTNDEIDFKHDYFALYYPSAIPNIQIGASGCLVDPQIPLRYGIQNAFDGDPATSFVENTETDFLWISIGIGNTFTGEIAIINGYAQNRSLYYANNRVKRITYNSNDTTLNFVLKDNTLNYQFINSYRWPFIVVVDIYPGTRYTDTCIAEFNIKTENGWLFGDIEE
jgi:hypothetical protein